MQIKHLVLGGGGAAGFTIYGALKHLEQNNYFNIKNIKSIHSCSAGSIVAALILLSSDWKDLDDYILKRPWDKVISVHPTDFIKLWEKKGIFSESVILDILKPFLLSKDLNEDLTLQQLYDVTNIDLFMYTTNINIDIPETVILSHTTHPSLTLIKAVTMSSAFPLIFEPIYYEDGCYIDGGFLNNFPLEDCIKLNNNEDEILAFKVASSNTNELIEQTSILPMYLYKLLEKMYKTVLSKRDNPKISNIVYCNIVDNSLKRWGLAVTDTKIREEYINNGIECAKIFIAN
tara:strand:+ start:2749 stop:3615 length:867 start_codon:yes stop_codon:yes gene_type:complete